MLLYVGVPGSFYFVDATATAGAGIAALIPLYLTVLAPVALLDAAMNQNRKVILLGALIAGPLSVFADGRLSTFSGLWSFDVVLVIYLVPMVVGGFAAFWMEGRALNSLIPMLSLTSLGERSLSD